MNVTDMNTLLAEFQLRFTSLNLVQNDLTPAQLDFLVHSQNPNYQAHSQIMQRHFEVDDQTLMDVLGLQVFEPGTAVPTGTVNFYVRSWSVPLTTLQTIMDWLCAEESEDFSIEEVNDWFDHIEAHQQDQMPIRIRYVGMCAGPTTPHDRHLEDTSFREHGLLSMFLHGLQRTDLACFNDVNILVAPNAALQGPVGRHTDLREQILINYFGLDKLLNQQIGGIRVWYAPSAQTIQNHQRYQNTLMQNLLTMGDDSRSGDQALSNEVEAWVERMCRAATDNAVCARLEQRPLNEDYLGMLTQQSTPTQTVYGLTIMATLGKDVTLAAMVNATPFFSTDSYAGHVTIASLQRVSGVHFDHGTIFTSFCDLYPWAGHNSTLPAAIQQLRDYMQTVQPLIAVTMSRPVTSVAMSNFLHPHGMPSLDDYMDYIGLPRLAFYPTDDMVNGPATAAWPNTHATIMVPHLHPGYQKHLAHSPIVSQIIDLCWAITMIIGELAANILKTNSTARNTEAAINALVPLIMPDSPNLIARLAYAYGDLAAAKQQYQVFATLRLARVRFLDQVQTRYNEVMSLAAYRRMDDIGRAVGPPHSHHRAVQVQRMWNMNYPQLHCHIPRDAQHQQQWFQWANSLQQGAFYFASAMRQAGLLHPVVHRLHSVLVQYPPDNATDDSWMANETLVLEALGRWSSYMRTFLPPDHFSPANQRLRVGQRWANERGVPFVPTIYTSMEHIEGREVVVSATYGVNFYWIYNDHDVTVRVRFPRSLMPIFQMRTSCQHFIVHFLPGGIGFSTLQGTPVMNGPSPIVISLSDINHFPYLPQLWAAERQRAGQQGLTVSPMVGTPGRPYFTVTTPAATLSNFGPILPNDAIALLRDFLAQDQFVHGGTLNTASNDVAVALRNPLVNAQRFSVAFSQYLQHRLEHPYAYQWLYFCDHIHMQGRHLRINLQFLRPIHSFRAIPTYTASGSRQSYIVLRFGPADPAGDTLLHPVGDLTR